MNGTHVSPDTSVTAAGAGPAAASVFGGSVSIVAQNAAVATAKVAANKPSTRRNVTKPAMIGPLRAVDRSNLAHPALEHSPNEVSQVVREIR